jgi:hypothetical protein
MPVLQIRKMRSGAFFLLFLPISSFFKVGMSRDKMDETKLRLPKKRQHITENKILADDGKTLNLEKYPKLQPKTDRPVQSSRSGVPIPSGIVYNLRN